MAKARDDGGAAFPSLERVSEFSDAKGQYVEHFMPFGGMSLRDYFAIHAPEPSGAQVQTEMERDASANPHGDSYKPRRRGKAEVIAALKYAYADAMLAERKK